MTNKFMKRRDKIRAQMKSRFYYWFWGATAVAVVGRTVIRWYILSCDGEINEQMV